MPQIPPSESGGGVEGQGGNCLGTVRMCGQEPERARVATCLAAVRSEASWTGSSSEWIWT